MDIVLGCECIQTRIEDGFFTDLPPMQCEGCGSPIRAELDDDRGGPRSHAESPAGAQVIPFPAPVAPAGAPQA